MPLVLLLHGTGDDAASVEQYLQFKPTADSKGFFLLRATGEKNLYGYTSWNADATCCSYLQNAPDDAGYLMGLIGDARGQVAVDSQRIYVVGHSAGGFMAYRLACDHADVIAGVASLAGATNDDQAACAPSAPVHVLQIHGDDDNEVEYGGGSFAGAPGSYPGAEETVADWASYDGCMATTTPGADVDLLDGDETTSESHGGCRAGGSAELWTMHGAGHTPDNFKAFSATVSTWLLARSKP